jgi:hypothetical protein
MPRRALLLLCACLIPLAPSGTTAGAGTPQVTFLLMRLDRETISLQHAYRFTQPLRKHLVPDGFDDWGEVFFRYEHHGDVNNIESLLSRYTGQVVFKAVENFQMAGSLLWPGTAEELIDRTKVLPAPEPQVLTVLPMVQILRPGQKDAIWSAVRDLEMVRDLSMRGPLHGVIFDFDFDGAVWADDPEILLLVWARDRAPSDVALVRQAWPRTLLTFGVRTTPEVTLHNFSDEPIDVTVNLEARRDGALVYRSSRTVQAAAPDVSIDVPLETMVPLHMAPLSFHATLSAPGGGAWLDAWSDNDDARGEASLTVRPVFRSRPWTKVPLWGQMIDFDGDRDHDVIMYLLPARLYQRDEQGRYTNISSRVQPPVLWDLRQAFASDFTGDGQQDLLLMQHAPASALLAGDGTGNFTQVPFPAVLAPLSEAFLSLFDLDLDGDQDILARRDRSDSHTAFFQDGPAHFVEDLPRTGLSPQELNGLPAFARIDGDERPDLLIARSDATDIYASLGGGVFQRSGRLPAARHAQPLDYDGDGLIDVLITASGNRLYRQSGPMVFEEVTGLAGDIGADRYLRSTQAADLNADGRPDLVLATNEGLKVKLTEEGLYTDATETLVERAPYDRDTVQLVDWDADGDVDIYSFWEAFENQGMPLARVEADVRIRSGSTAGHVPMTSQGWLEITLMGSTALDVRHVDLSTVAFGNGRLPVPPDARVRYEDANHDRIEDLSIRLRADDSGLTSTAQEACLEGWTRQGLPFRGCAHYVPVGPNR